MDWIGSLLAGQNDGVECDVIVWMADPQRWCSGLVIDSMIVLASVGSYEAESVVAFVHLEYLMVSLL